MKARSAAIRGQPSRIAALRASIRATAKASMPAAATAQIEVDVLLTREAEQFLDAFLAPDAGLLVAAEGRAEEMLGDVVDPDIARFHGAGGAVRGYEIVGPDRAGEPVLDPVHLLQHRGLVAPFEDRENRAEDFLLADAHIHVDVGEDGGLDEQALGELGIARAAAAADEARTLALGGFDEAHDAVVLHLADDRPHGGGRIGGNAGPVALDRARGTLQDGIVD